MSNKQPPTNGEVRNAFIHVIQVYNTAPIQEIRDDFHTIHKTIFQNRGTDFFFLFDMTAKEHMRIMEYIGLETSYKEHEDFCVMFAEYMKTMLDYRQMYIDSNQGKTGVA